MRTYNYICAFESCVSVGKIAMAMVVVLSWCYLGDVESGCGGGGTGHVEIQMSGRTKREQKNEQASQMGSLERINRITHRQIQMQIQMQIQTQMQIHKSKYKYKYKNNWLTTEQMFFQF